jgi:hypothetical protein
MALDWSHHPFPDVGFRERASEFVVAAPGATMSIPIQPPGWEVTLTKRPSPFSGR